MPYHIKINDFIVSIVSHVRKWPKLNLSAKANPKMPVDEFQEDPFLKGSVEILNFSDYVNNDENRTTGTESNHIPKNKMHKEDADFSSSKDDWLSKFVALKCNTIDAKQKLQKLSECCKGNQTAKKHLEDAIIHLEALADLTQEMAYSLQWEKTKSEKFQQLLANMEKKNNGRIPSNVKQQK